MLPGLPSCLPDSGAVMRCPNDLSGETGVRRPRCDRLEVEGALQMQMVYRAKDLVDAQVAADVLAHHGIDSHISGGTGSDSGANELIAVSVDNRSLDAARRVIAAWRRLPGAVMPTAPNNRFKRG